MPLTSVYYHVRWPRFARQCFTCTARPKFCVTRAGRHVQRIAQRGDVMFCSFCGSRNSDNFQFCASCGKQRASIENKSSSISGDDGEVIELVLRPKGVVILLENEKWDFGLSESYKKNGGCQTLRQRHFRCHIYKKKSATQARFKISRARLDTGRIDYTGFGGSYGPTWKENIILIIRNFCQSRRAGY